jgi:hypothetical protein
MGKVSRSALVKKYDAIFSEYVRRRHGEYPECFTCGKKDHWKKLQAGHFQSRGKYSTRWDEQNVQVQCVKCNIFNQGEQYKFAQRLDEVYGEGTADGLVLKGNQIVKISNADIAERIEEIKKVVQNFG